MAAVVWHSELHCRPFIHTSLLASVHCRKSLESLWSGLKPLVSVTLAILGPYWGTPLDYPAVALCGGDPAALGLQDPSLQVFQQIADGIDLGVGQLITLVLGLGSCRVGQPASSPLSPPPRWALLHPPGKFTLCSDKQGARPSRSIFFMATLVTW